MKHLKKYIKFINELRTDVDEVLDKMVDKKPIDEYDKLILANESGDKEGMKKLSFDKIYKDNGGTFVHNNKLDVQYNQ